MLHIMHAYYDINISLVLGFVLTSFSSILLICQVDILFPALAARGHISSGYIGGLTSDPKILRHIYVEINHSLTGPYKKKNIKLWKTLAKKKEHS